MNRRIEDYALIGDTHTAALVGRDGSVDWLCLPRFDSDACFAALLGTDAEGLFRIAPSIPVKRVERRYRPGTLVLETVFYVDGGAVRVTDAMPPRTSIADIVRVVEGLQGEVPMLVVCRPRMGYGSLRPWFRREGGNDWLAIAGPDALLFRSSVELSTEDSTLVGDFVVRRGDKVPFVLAWGPSHLPPPQPVNPFTALAETEAWWTEWVERCCIQGEWRAAVQESLVVLKALTYLPTGGIVAAPTTSLPEWPGGVRNWDYRYCWLRDATFTLYALMDAGFMREARAWRDWLLRSVAGDPSQIQIMYGVAGERRLPELELPWLPGFNGSRPVRIGNDAVNQFQLDIYGEVMDVLHQARKHGMPEDDAAWRLEVALIEYLSKNWRRPDRGIWEVRGPERHFTHSRVMCWVAVDRAIKGAEATGAPAPLDAWRALREEIRQDVLTKSWDASQNTFVQYQGGDHVDASLLLMPLVGFLPADDPRVVGTVAAVERELLLDGFVRRYVTRPSLEGLPHDEGVFLACSFWLVDNLHLQGRRAEALALFERLLALRNDVGLLAEEYDPDGRRMLGNFPQAFSHVALINSARLLSAAPGGPSQERSREHDPNEGTG